MDFAAFTETPGGVPMAFVRCYTGTDGQSHFDDVDLLPPDMESVIEGPACAVNAWQVPGWPGRSRGEDNTERLDLIRSAGRSHDREFEWLRPPILNRRTRLALVADASNRSVVAQGYE